MLDSKELLLPYKEHLNEIRKALKKNDAYLFIGAGFSMNAELKEAHVQNTFKTWTAFMKQLAQRLWPGLNERELEQKIAGNHLYIAQLFTEEFGTSAFYKELLQAVPYKDYIPSLVHHELIGLEGWQGFITTNQDCLIEQTLDQLHLYHDVVISDIDIATKPASIKLFKLHGSMEQPESIIFTEEQYRTYEHNHPLLYVKVKSIFAEHCVVFVGFSLTDANFKAIYGWVKDVLQTDYQRKAYAFVMEDDIDPYTKRYWEKRNIILLPIFTKDHRNKGLAFQDSLKMYIDILKIGPEPEKTSNDHNLAAAFSCLLESEKWDKEKTKELLRLIDQIPMENDYDFADPFVKFHHKHGANLDKEDLFLLFETVYKRQLLFPLFLIEGRTLIDRIIDLLEKDPNGGELYYQYLFEKAEVLLSIGKYDELESLVKGVLEKEQNLSVDMRNSFLYLQIIIEKYHMNFERIHELLRQIAIDWEQPIWLNRLASLYLLLGEKSMALNFYNRAIQSAEHKRDIWNLYIANLSRLYLMNDLFDDSFTEQEKKEVQLTVHRVSQNLKEIHHPTFERWQEFDRLKADWSEYKNWKSKLGKNQRGFNSIKGNSIYSVYEMISFNELNGLPHVSMIGKNFNVVLDIFIENQQRVRGTSFAILFGHEAELQHAYRVGELSEITAGDCKLLYHQSLSYTENVIWYIRSLRNNSYCRFVELWLPALIQFWIQVIPILKDEAINQVTDYCFALYGEVQKIPAVDRFTNARSKLITALGLCFYFRQQSKDQSYLFETLRQSVSDFRLIEAFSHIYWGDFAKQSIPDDILKGIADHLDYSSVNLINQWLEAELLSEEQKRLVYQKVYKRSLEGKEIEKARFLYLRFFNHLLEAGIVQEIIEYGINQFSGSLSSANGIELYQLAQDVEQMNSDQLQRVLDAIEHKLSDASARNSFITQEIQSWHLYFLYKLWKFGKFDDQELLGVLSKVDHLERNLADLVAELAHHDIFTEVLINKLIDTSYSYQANSRKNSYLLIGFWLKERTELGEKENDLIKRILAGLDDSNVEVASTAVQSVAFILRDHPSLISELLLESIVQLTERGTKRNDISYLTNLAFLYKELSKQELLPESVKDKVMAVVTQLSQSSFSNVRRECRLEG